MKRAAQKIEEAKEARSVKSPKKSPSRERHPNSLKNLMAPWPKGKSANPGGKPKIDVARIIAQAILEGNKEAAYRALGAALLKGNVYVFKELADRAYGKVKEVHEVTGTDGGPIEYTIRFGDEKK